MTEKVGSVVFGPRISPEDRRYWDNVVKGVGSYSVKGQAAHVQSCNCIGPQPGETKCPCALAGELRQGRKMIDEGVVINGRRYRLVPDSGGASHG